jgi:hypothetical protein
MPTTIVRLGSLYDPITLTNSVSTTGGFSLSTDAGALLLVDSKSAAGSITISFFAKGDGKLADAYALVDASGSPITQAITANGQCFPMPDGLFASRHVLMVVSSGTASVRIVTKG